MTGAGLAFLAIPEAVILGLIAAGAGRRLCSKLLPDASTLELSVFGFPVGMALLSLLMTGLLFANVPAIALPFVLGAVLIGAAAWGRREAVDLVRDLRQFTRESPMLAAMVAASVALGAVGCLAPETGWDTGVYHFAMARLRAEQGGMLVRPDVPHGYRPAGLESLHTVGFVLNGEALASFFNETFYVAGLALARLWGLRLAGPRGGLFAALAWLGSITYVLRMDGGDVEVGQAVYLGVTLLALLKLRDGGGPGWRVLAGGALGMLAGMKYASLYAAVVVAAVWLVVRLRDRTALRTVLTDGLVIGLLSLLIACPWYVRNKLMMGSLFYPYAAPGVAGVGEAPSAGTGAAMALIRSLGMDGLIVVGALALLLPRVARDRWAGIVSILLPVLLLRQSSWSLLNITNVLRYSSPAWLPLLVFAGVAVAHGVERGGAVRLLAVAVLLGAVGLGQGVLAARNLPKLPAALGLVSRDTYLAGRVNTYDAVRRAEAELPSGKRILLVEERVYYCRASFLAASDIQDFVSFARIGSAAELRRFLDAESIGAIVVNRSANAKIWGFRDLERRLGADWPPAGVRPVTIPGDASLYRVE